MKKYLKMSDVFCKTDAVETNVIVAFAVAVDCDDGVTPHEYAHHAIQRHDELVDSLQSVTKERDELAKEVERITRELKSVTHRLIDADEMILDMLDDRKFQQ